MIHSPPQVVEGRLLFPFEAGSAVLAAFKKAMNFPTGDLGGRARQQISAFGASPRLDESTLLQAGQDQLQKLLRDLLSPGDIGDLDGLTGRLSAEIKDRLQGVLTLYGNLHSAGTAI